MNFLKECSYSILNEGTKFYAANDNRAGLSHYTLEAMKANRPIIEAPINFCHPRRPAHSQMALGWIVPIPGNTKLTHLQENLMVADLQFSPEELRDMDNAIVKITIHGEPVCFRGAKTGIELIS